MDSQRGDKSERWLARTFVELADTLVDDFDVVDLLSTLAERCAGLLDAAEVGLLLADSAGALHVMSSSSERSQVLELFELQVDEGPCVDCYVTGQQVRNVSLRASSTLWPNLAPIALAAGLQMVHALPMRLRQRVIGSVNVFHAEERILTEHDFELAQALADAATIAILQDRSIRSATQTAEQLQRALDSRIVIEQAKGVIAEKLNVDMEEAFSLLRRYARDRNQRLGDVAERVTAVPLSVEGALAADLETMFRSGQ